jgi:anti-sigma regulatory factor (Ser/Thr protein kinase)
MRIEGRRVYLAAERSACSVARVHVGDFGARHGIDVEDAALCATEMLANAIRADEQTPGRIGLVKLTIVAFHPEALLVAVRDWGRGVPMMRKPDVGDDMDVEALPDGGRGLVLVDAPSSAWGVAGNRDGGKTVWCRLPLERVATPPTRRDAAVPSRFSAEDAVPDRVLRRMCALWPGPCRPRFRGEHGRKTRRDVRRCRRVDLSASARHPWRADADKSDWPVRATRPNGADQRRFLLHTPQIV